MATDEERADLDLLLCTLDTIATSDATLPAVALAKSTLAQLRSPRAAELLRAFKVDRARLVIASAGRKLRALHGGE
jgi:hypothetical protein